ncbi:ferric reductase-like transmembrane domain-containing protein [Actinoalloteichus hymeniacidonis]|uniref:Ferric reductase like transmembrane component n=1 Tax=Actinoalloteichus hymeniacidonis TaxID=340345 RepID=A0AAC9MYP7_9PSEU|nr:ferric reductase-like transmembrane domain-containing protein [Actinoalloteichus hymeniacidonis]AOS63510.1 Ferric reductase like transmembrane component [Actinoalloteichus hymeniacidonis]MBB5908446.1 DMSO/TMAO reductase YedYZ heme-binding membrane subunit [Actinoalloteichus hymeniacidonis]
MTTARADGPEPGENEELLVERTDDAPRRSRGELRTDLVATSVELVIATVLTSAVFLLLYQRIEADTSDTTLVMPFMNDAAMHWPYWLSQAFGWTALLWSWVTVMLGLAVSGRSPDWLTISPARMERLHRSTSLTTIVLIFAHALVLSWDPADPNLAGSFIPWMYSHPPGRFGVALGVIAFWLAIPLGLSFYLRRRIGPRTWRIAHRFVIVVYILGVWHTLLWGTNVWFDGWVRWLLWALQIPVAVLLVARLLAPARRGERLPLRLSELRQRWSGGTLARLGGRLVAVLAAVALVVVVVTGSIGGRDREDYDRTPAETGHEHEH